MLTKIELQKRRRLFAADAAIAMAEYLAEPEAVRIRTAELKAMRLEREAAEAAVVAAAATEKAKKVAATQKRVEGKPLKPRKRVLTSKPLPH